MSAYDYILPVLFANQYPIPTACSHSSPLQESPVDPTETHDMGETQAMLLGAVNHIYAARRTARHSSAAATPSIGLETRSTAALRRSRSMRPNSASSLKTVTSRASPSPSEVISETEDETQGPELTLPLPTVTATSAQLLEEMEGDIAALKASRSKDRDLCEKLERNLIRYKNALEDDQKKTQGACEEMGRARASLGVAQAILSRVAAEFGLV